MTFLLTSPFPAFRFGQEEEQTKYWPLGCDRGTCGALSLIPAELFVGSESFFCSFFFTRDVFAKR